MRPSRDTQADKSVRLPLTDYALLRRIALEEDRPLRAVIARALQMYAPKLAAEVKRAGVPA
jgi:hypothetical protein